MAVIKSLIVIKLKIVLNLEELDDKINLGIKLNNYIKSIGKSANHNK